MRISDLIHRPAIIAAVSALTTGSAWGAQSPQVGAAPEALITWYVDAEASGANDGTTWTDAFIDLQAALAAATAGDQIWVAAGTYKPALPGGPRTATFQLADGVALYGSFAGGESSVDERDIDTNVTTLSGDLTGDDGPNFTNRSENSYHVVTGPPSVDPPSPAMLDGFTISGGFANTEQDSGGGGMLNLTGSPVVAQCTFRQNSARYSGGGVHNGSGHAIIQGCRFMGNVTTSGTLFRGGGGLFNGTGNPQIVNSIFSKNSSAINSGGFGGGIFSSEGRPVIAHCTLVGNAAGLGNPSRGGGIFFERFVPVVTHCILWNNRAGSGYFKEEDQVWTAGGVPLLNYCAVSGWTGSFGGSGNFGLDPLFVDLAGEDYHLQPGSPCVNAGDSAAVPDGADIDGEDRVQHCRIDVGADETPYFLDCNNNTLADTCEIAAGSAADCDGNGVPDGCESNADCDTNGIQDICDLASGAAGDCNANGIPDACDLALGTSPDADGNDVPDECPIRYVDRDATGANNGSSWTDAYTSLQTALVTAGPGYQVWIAAGTYRPDAANGSRNTSFSLTNGVAIYGGYAGAGAPDPNARDLLAYETILSGDLNGNDVGTNGIGENSYHVVKAGGVGQSGGVGPSAVLDGVTITGGNANNLEDGSGGGLFAENGSPTLVDCTFRTNRAVWDGGGMCVFRGQPALTGCRFEENSAGHEGGGLCARDASPTLTRCTFTKNVAVDGGGMCFDAYYVAASASLLDCAFFGNTADATLGHGGGLWTGGSATLINARFSGNAAAYGGAIQNSWAALTVANSTLSGNVAAISGGGVLTEGASAALNVVSSILWNNLDLSDAAEEAQLAAPSGTADVNYSCIEGLSGALGGTGNIGDDPLLVDADGTDNILGTPDDDLRLAAESPCVDTGTTIDGDTPFDFEGDPRVQQCRADIGADETPHFDDCNANALPDGCDIAAGTSLDCVGNSNGIPDECEADCNANAQPDACDLAAGTSADCNANAVPDECDIAAGHSPDGDGGGVPDECEATILYVDADAAGLGNGTTWTDALTDLKRALAIAAHPDSAATEVWVAAGTYRPTQDGSRTTSFRLRSNLALYGGFTGGETALAERDLRANLSVLSGDLAGDDAGMAGQAENSFHVLVADDVDASAVLDGFVIVRGNADGTAPHDRGGGLMNADGRPTIANCTFAGNLGILGGGLANEGGTPVVVNCVFTGNVAAKGGAMFHRNSGNATITGCTMAGNVAADAGGVFNEFSSPTIANSVLWGNVDFGDSTEAAQIRRSGAAVRHSCVEGLSGALGGVGNIGSDPQFADEEGADGVPGTVDDDLRLSEGSPCVDAGDNAADLDVNTSGVQPLPDRDRDGLPRQVDDPDVVDTGSGAPPIVDLGAFERQGSGVPAATITAAVSRKHCDLTLLPGTKSEPRLGGITELRIAFDLAPGGPGNNPVTLEVAVCPAPPAYGPYAGSSVLTASVEGVELVLIFTPGLENGRTYRLTVGPEVTALPGQTVEVRGLIGDVNSSGRVNGNDRSAVVSAWTGPDNFSCATDLDGNDRTHGPDRSIVVAAWTSTGNCAP